MFPSHLHCLCLFGVFEISTLSLMYLINEAKGVALALHGRIVLKEGK